MTGKAGWVTTAVGGIYGAICDCYRPQKFSAGYSSFLCVGEATSADDYMLE
jgi:hypothetical protein